MLERPERRNAVPVAGWHALADAAGSLARSDVRAVVVQSAVSGNFSAGADISAFDELRHDASARVRFREAMRSGIDAVAGILVPVVAAVDGGCFGAAVAMVLACDLIVAGDDAMFAITPAKLGLGYPGEDVARLIGRVGRGQASRMLLVADPIGAEEAHRIGLADWRAPDAAMFAHEIAIRVASLAPGAVRLLKRTVADPADPAHSAAFDEAFAGDEFAERLAAFRSRPR